MTAGPGGEGFFAALKNLLATLVGIGKTRLELLSVELQEEKLRLVGLLAYALATLFCLGVAVVLAVAWVAVAFWEQRVLVFGLFTVLFLAVAAILARLAAKAAGRGSPVFRSSLAELQADLIALRGDGKAPERQP